MEHYLYPPPPLPPPVATRYVCCFRPVVTLPRRRTETKTYKQNPATLSSFPGMPQTFPVNNLAAGPVNLRPTRDHYVRNAPESLPTIPWFHLYSVSYHHNAVVTVTNYLKLTSGGLELSTRNFCFFFKFLSERATRERLPPLLPFADRAAAVRGDLVNHLMLGGWHKTDLRGLSDDYSISEVYYGKVDIFTTNLT